MIYLDRAIKEPVGERHCCRFIFSGCLILIVSLGESGDSTEVLHLVLSERVILITSIILGLLYQVFLLLRLVLIVLMLLSCRASTPLLGLFLFCRGRVS